jgi:hypothetical protein
MNKPVELPEADLPIDPYVLGCWLGDGTSAKPEFTVHKDDLSMYDTFIKLFGSYKVYTDHRNSNTLSISFAGDRG